MPAARRRPAATPVPLPQTWADRDDAELTARTERLRSGERYDGVHLTGAAHAGTYCPDVRLLECAVRGMRWDSATLSGSEFIDVLLDEVAASTLTVTSSTWRDVLWRGCRLGAVQAYGSSWHGVGIEGGRWDYLNLRGSQLERVRVDGCHLGELDLGEAAVRELTVTDSRIDRLVLTHARLTAVDLRGAELAEIVGVAELSGATISEQHLHDLARPMARILGIVVDGDEDRPPAE